MEKSSNNTILRKETLQERICKSDQQCLIGMTLTLGPKSCHKLFVVIGKTFFSCLALTIGHTYFVYKILKGFGIFVRWKAMKKDLAFPLTFCLSSIESTKFDR